MRRRTFLKGLVGFSIAPTAALKTNKYIPSIKTNTGLGHLGEKWENSSVYDPRSPNYNPVQTILVPKHMEDTARRILEVV